MTAFDWHLSTGWAGGLWGDVAGSLVWAVLAFGVAVIFWPPLRQAIERLFHRVFNSHPIHDQIAELHKKLDRLDAKHDLLAEQVRPRAVATRTIKKKAAPKKAAAKK